MGQRSRESLDSENKEALLGDPRRGLFLFRCQLSDSRQNQRQNVSEHNEGSRWLIRDHGRQGGSGSGPECLCIGLSEAVAEFFGDATPFGGTSRHGRLSSTRISSFPRNSLRPRSFGIFRRSRKRSILRCASRSGSSDIWGSRSR